MLQLILKIPQFSKCKFQNRDSQYIFVQELINQLKNRNYDKN